VAEEAFLSIIIIPCFAPLFSFRVKSFLMISFSYTPLCSCTELWALGPKMQKYSPLQKTPVFFPGCAVNFARQHGKQMVAATGIDRLLPLSMNVCRVRTERPHKQRFKMRFTGTSHTQNPVTPLSRFWRVYSCTTQPFASRIILLSYKPSADEQASN
jgi:hypothetical protein